MRKQSDGHLNAVATRESFDSRRGGETTGGPRSIRPQIVVPLFHLVAFLGLCAALGCAYKARSRRRFERACERAQLFSSDPKAFFREKQYRKPALVEPEGPPV